MKFKIFNYEIILRRRVALPFIFLNEPQMRDAFSAGPQHPLILAHAAILCEYKQTAIENITSQQLNDRQVDMLRGAIDVIDDIQKQISEEVLAYNKVDEPSKNPKSDG